VGGERPEIAAKKSPQKQRVTCNSPLLSGQVKFRHFFVFVVDIARKSNFLYQAETGLQWGSTSTLPFFLSSRSR
jgi:hypothetical protein